VDFHYLAADASISSIEANFFFDMTWRIIRPRPAMCI